MQNEIKSFDRTWAWWILMPKNRKKRYYNENRGHAGIDGAIPLQKSENSPAMIISLNHYRWKKHCRGLFQLPIAA